MILDLIKSVIQILKPEFGFELTTYSDVPPGSGLGGSAVLLSAIQEHLIIIKKINLVTMR